MFNKSNIDLAPVEQVSRLIRGEIYKYSYVQGDIDEHRLVQDIILNVSQNNGFNEVMRV